MKNNRFGGFFTAKLNIASLQDITADNGISIGVILKGILTAYIITIIIFLVFAVVITYTDFPESAIPAVVVVTTIISIIIAGSKVASRAKSKGWLNGAIAGILYMTILYIASSLIFNGFTFDRYVIYMFILGLFSGAFGGIIGINLKGSGRRR